MSKLRLLSSTDFTIADKDDEIWGRPDLRNLFAGTSLAFADHHSIPMASTNSLLALDGEVRFHPYGAYRSTAAICTRYTSNKLRRLTMISSTESEIRLRGSHKGLKVGQFTWIFIHRGRSWALRLAAHFHRDVLPATVKPTLVQRAKIVKTTGGSAVLARPKSTWTVPQDMVSTSI